MQMQTTGSDAAAAALCCRNRDQAVLRFEAALRRIGASELLRSHGGPACATDSISTMGIQVCLAHPAAAPRMSALPGCHHSQVACGQTFYPFTLLMLSDAGHGGCCLRGSNCPGSAGSCGSFNQWRCR